MDIGGFTFRSQRGITLIEILLVAVIVAASVVGVFIFAEKSTVSASVKEEQAQVEELARTVESLFIMEPNFQALGNDGADFIHSRLGSTSNIVFEKDSSGKYSLISSLGGGTVVNIRSAQVDFPNGTPGHPNNGFVLSYSNLSSSECAGLVTSTSALATRIDVSPAGSPAPSGSPSGPSASSILVSSLGHLDTDKAKISSACSVVNGQKPTVHLSFAPSRPISPALAPPVSPGSTCMPVTETQVIGCPAGYVGSIIQQRHGVCSGPGGSMLYTSWTTTEDTCVTEASAPPSLVAAPAPTAVCSTITLSQVVSCPAGQNGFIVQARTLDTCSGVYGPWEDTSVNCTSPVVQTCFPSSEHENVPCPSGMSGVQRRTRGLHCPSPTAPAPVPMPHDPWTVYENTCQGTPSCSPVRETRDIRCPVGYYGDYHAYQERFRACAPDNEVGAWSSWANYSDPSGIPPIPETGGTCTACPPSVEETDYRWVGRSSTCPSGYLGDITWEAEQVRTRTRSYDCPERTLTLPSPSYTAWTSYSDTGNTRDYLNTCEVECVAPADETETRTVSCPSGQLGQIIQSRTITWSCPNATGSPTSSPSDWTEVSNTCTPSPTCSGPNSQTQWVATTGSCPSGYTGSNTWEREQIQTRTCNSGTWSSWSSWSNTGNTRAHNNTCTPPPTYNGLCTQVSRPTSWGCGIIRRVSGTWQPVAGTVEINSGSNFVLLGDGYEGTRCVFGYSDVLDSNGYPTQLSSADAAKFVYDSAHPAPDSFFKEYRNQSNMSGVGETAYGHVYARNSGPNPRGNQCHWTKFELMNNG